MCNEAEVKDDCLHTPKTGLTKSSDSEYIIDILLVSLTHGFSRASFCIYDARLGEGIRGEQRWQTLEERRERGRKEGERERERGRDGGKLERI